MSGYWILFVGFVVLSYVWLFFWFFADENEPSSLAVAVVLFGGYVLNGSWVGGLALIGLLSFDAPKPIAAILCVVISFFAGRYIGR